MTTVFDGTSMPFDQYLELVFPGIAALVLVVVLLRCVRRRWPIIMAGVTLLLFVLFFILPLADHRHVQAAAATKASKVIEGRISGFKHEVERRFTGTSRGVGISTSRNYTTVVTEQFFIGDVWFWYEIGEFPSRASFTNIGQTPLKLADGMQARAVYFEDPWYDRQRRIISLALSGSATARASEAPALDPAFETFWKRFSAASAKGDKAAVKAMTRFPFLFAGTPLGADRFDTIWMGLFPEPNRACLASVRPVRDGDAMSVSCGVYVYVFERDEATWTFSSFTADPEAQL